MGLQGSWRGLCSAQRREERTRTKCHGGGQDSRGQEHCWREGGREATMALCDSPAVAGKQSGDLGVGESGRSCLRYTAMTLHARLLLVKSEMPIPASLLVVWGREVNSTVQEGFRHGAPCHSPCLAHHLSPCHSFCLPLSPSLPFSSQFFLLTELILICILPGSPTASLFPEKIF